MEQKTFGLDAYALKCIMAVLMLLDHLYAFIPGMPVWFTWLGRLVAPVFCYLMTQGLVYTSNRTAYIGRLFTASAVMFAGNYIVYRVFDHAISSSIFHYNIFLSLAVSAGIIACLDKIAARESWGFATVLCILLLTLSVYTEGSIIIPTMALVFYYLRKQKLVMCLAYVGVMLFIVPMLWKNSFPQILMVGAVIPIFLYDGKRGSGGAGAKYFFYVFYPAHIWALFSLRQLFWN